MSWKSIWKAGTATLIAAACLSFLHPQPIDAQSPTTSAIAGRVLDEQGAPLANVQVIATNQATGHSLGVLTRADGRYQLPGLQPGGPYRISASMIGYATNSVDDVSLILGRTSDHGFTLRPEAIALAAIDVVAGRGSVMASDRTGAATVFGRERIERTPTISRDFTDYARIVPQINTSSGMSAGGRNNRFNNIQIDGAVNNDLFGLAASGTPGGQAGARPITIEAIQEVSVVIAPMDVRQSGFTGAGINAVTRSGTNTLHGTLAYFTRNQDFVGRYTVPMTDTAAAKVANFEQSNIAFSLGGPIIENRAHFFVAGEMSGREAPLGFVADQGSGVTSTDAQRIQQILRSQYGYEAGAWEDVDLTRNDKNIFARFDLSVTPEHRLTLRHNHVNAGDDNLSRSNASYRLTDQLYTFKSVTNSTVAQLNSSFSGNFFNEFRIGYQTIRDKRAIGNQFPAVRVTVPGGNVFAGHEQFSGGNALNQDILEITNDLTIPFGPHDVTIGTSNQFFKFSNLFVRNLFGYYEFPSMDALETGAANRFEYSYLLPGGRERAEFPVQLLSAYVQDSWTVSDRLRLTGGIRIEMPAFNDSPGQNDEVTRTVSRDGKPVRTDEVPSGKFLINPRIGFNWNVAGDGSTQLRGGVGLFSGRTPGVWISNAYGNTGVDYARFTCTGAQTPAFVADPAQQPRGCAGSTSLAPNEINTIDPDFKLPQVVRASLAIDRELPFGAFLTLEGLFTGSRSDVLPRELMVGSPDGTIEGRTRWSRVDAPFTNVIDITNTSKNRYYSFTTELTRPLAGGWSASAAYTWSRAEDVNSTTSSQALSNWRFNPIVDNPDDPELRPANFDVTHRLLASALYEASLIRGAPTQLSFVVTRDSGRPYTFTYGGSGANADVNYDGSNGNDLVFVPANSGQIRFTGTPAEQAESWANLDAFISSTDCLNEARGTVLKRNACREPSLSRLDLRFAQVIPSVRDQRIQLTLDIINFGNLLNRDWGLSEFVPNQNDITVFYVNNRTPDADGRVLMQPVRSNPRVLQVSNLASRYEFQIGVRYSF